MNVSDLSSIYVKPIVRFQQLGERAFKPIEAVGTGTLIGDHKFLTCWHCVSAKLGTNEVYGIPYKPVESADVVHSEMTTIVDIERDLNGTDLALASIPLRADPPIPLSRTALDWGDWAMSCGASSLNNEGVATAQKGKSWYPSSRLGNRFGGHA